MDNRAFLNGIDDEFLRLMNQRGNTKSNGQAPVRPPQESTTSQITARLGSLSHEQRESVLAFIESLLHKDAR